MTRKCHVRFGEEGACFLPEAIQAKATRSYSILHRTKELVWSDCRELVPFGYDKACPLYD